ncbi:MULTISPECIES: TonB-dependent siderophore receptor [Olivibacter]|jgi:iron complex outermembrane receptor protein|uniref:TonB-dependent siderophore receptor n=1 Tax=Olivibacter oleidegradans TaxID=760123 RepID=A0ABV6HH63_9SPHI|nr:MULTISPECIES: TonB-dependent siderophore receptor [Olivibacter]QEL00673.1 TonB-dependent receptor [Olivibacter sp. LS-1]
MRYLLIIAILLLASRGLAQSSIDGLVTDETGRSIAGASVSLKGKNMDRTGRTDENGHFTLTALQEGAYEINASHIGYGNFHEAVVLGKKPIAVKIVLISKSSELQLVEVSGRVARKYTSNYSFGATRTSTLTKEIPQSISAITKELIADRQAFQLADAVKMASGVTPSSYYNQYAIRGISQNEEGQIINGMRTRQYYFLQPLTSNIERVEVIKGPASATFSSVDPGGSINLVTKKPLAIERREANISAGSFSTIRGSLDFTGPLNSNKTLLYRINAAYQEAGSFRDLVDNKSFLVSPSFSYIPNDKTAVNVEVILSDLTGDLDRGQPIFGAVAGQTNLNSTPINRNLAAPGDFFKSKDLIVMGNFSHKFTDAISLNASYMKQNWHEDLQEHRTTGAFAPDTVGNPVNSLAAMQFVQRKQSWSTDNFQGYFNFDLKTGRIQHKLLMGYDLSRWQKLKGGGQDAARGFLLRDGGVTNTFSPTNLADYQVITIGNVTMPRPNVDYFDLNNPIYTMKRPEDYNLNIRTALPAALTTTHAVYIQDQLRWNRFIVLLGLRQEWFRDITNYKSSNESSFTNKAFLPRVGITYVLNKQVNIYGTYLEGFQPQSNTVTLMPSTGGFFGSPESAARFKPLTSNLKELGTKTTWWEGKLSVNAAVYEINQQNILMNAGLPAYPDSLVTRGADRSRGFEIEVAGFIRSNWQVNLSYSYIDAKILEDANASIKGSRKENTPVNSGNLWTRYDFQQDGVLKDLGIGLGLQYSGDKIPWFTREFKVPAYTLLDIALYYKPGKGSMQIAFNMNNVTNKRYWIGAQNYLRLFPGAPRNIMLTTSYQF